MVTIVLVLGLLNLGLGFALAVLLERPLTWPRGWSLSVSLSVPWTAPWRLARIPKLTRSKPPPEADGAAGADPFARVLAEGIDPASFSESVLWAVRLEAVDYRQELVNCEQRHRHGAPDAVDAIVARTEAWHQYLSALFDALSSYDDEEEPELKHDLEEALLDHIFQVQSCEQIERLVQRGETDEVTSRISKLNAGVDSLRDFVDDCLGNLLREQERLKLVKKRLQKVPESSVLTRLGLETMFRDWCSKDADRVRLVSCVLMDLDRFDAVNDRWGHDIGDRISVAFQVLIQDQVRKGRGFDRVARISGQSLLLFLGDTGARNASSGAERMRQTLEATSFRTPEDQIELTVSCGIAELDKQEEIPQLLARLKASVAETKKAGGNQTAIDSGSGPQLVKSPQYKVEGRVIDI